MPITKISSDRNSNKHIRPSNSDLGNSLTLATTSNQNEEFCIPELEAWFIEIAHSGTLIKKFTNFFLKILVSSL